LSILLVLCRELVTVMFRYHNRFFAPRHYIVNTLLVVNSSVNMNKPICYWAKRDYTTASKDWSGINQCKENAPLTNRMDNFNCTSTTKQYLQNMRGLLT